MGIGEARAFFLLLMTSDCSYEFLQMSFATELINGADVNARLPSVFMSVGDCIQSSKSQSNNSPRAPFCAISIIICSTKWKFAVFRPSFADAKLVWNAS